MGYAVRMPKMGMTMEEGSVVAWHVAPGEEVEEGDLVVEVESEKTINEVTAREGGTLLAQLVDPGESVAPGDPIGYVGDPDGTVPDEVVREAGGRDGEGDADGSSVEAEAADAGTGAEAADADAGAEAAARVDADADATAGSSPSPANAGEVVSIHRLDADVSPRARARAAELGLGPETLDRLSGTGPGGAVVERDVTSAATGDGATAGTTGTAGTGADTGAGTAGADAVDEAVAIRETRTLTGMRKSIADRMTASATEIPQVTLNRRVRVDAVLDTMERLEADRGVDVSIEDFLLAAVADAAERHPELNARYVDGEHRIAADVNVSVAVDVEEGLLTPVVRRVQGMTVEEIGRERRSLVDAARAGEYDAALLQGGTFTVTNLGALGIDSFDPLINPPQVAILGVGRLRRDDHATLPLSLTFDHRVADGADAARFLSAIVDALDRPLDLVAGGRSGSGVDGGGARGVDDPAAGSRPADPRLGESLSVPDDETVRARSTAGLTAEVGARRFRWTVDEPEDRGGTDSAPTPVEGFLGSLSSCLALTTRLMADRREVPIEEITVDVTPDPSAHDIDALRIRVAVTSPADPDDVERVVGIAERACPVNSVVSEDVDRDLSVSVSGPDG